MPPNRFKAAGSSWIRERVVAGRYRVSEHILRFMTTGLLTLGEIEAALSNGRVVEVRRNQRGDGSCLVRGDAEGRALSLVCTRAADDALTVLLAKVTTRVWEKMEDIQPTKGEVMPDAMPGCFFCGGDVKPIVVGNFDYRLEGQLYVIKNVPAGLCVECGEKYITSETAKKINALVLNKAFLATETVHVGHFT